MSKTTPLKKSNIAAKSTKKLATYTEAEKAIRTQCLVAACQLVSNPVHALAATPQNVMLLAGIFANFVEGTEIPQAQTPANEQDNTVTYG